MNYELNAINCERTYTVKNCKHITSQDPPVTTLDFDHESTEKMYRENTFQDTQNRG